MSWEEVLAHGEEKKELIEWRGRITKEQKDKLEELERDLKIPQAALVRLALKTFLPFTKNQGFKSEGIRQVWDDNKF